MPEEVFGVDEGKVIDFDHLKGSGVDEKHLALAARIDGFIDIPLRILAFISRSGIDILEGFTVVVNNSDVIIKKDIISIVNQDVIVVRVEVA